MPLSASGFRPVAQNRGFRADPVRNRTIRRARLSSLAAPDRGLVDPGLAFEVLSTRLVFTVSWPGRERTVLRTGPSPCVKGGEKSVVA